LNAWTVLFLGALGAYFAAFLLYPVGFMLRRAFGADGEFTLRYFSLLLANPMSRQSILTSFALATITTALASCLVLPLAYGMTRWRFAGRGFLSTLLLVPMILPPFVGAIGLKQLLARFGSLNSVLVELGWMDPARPVDWLGAGGFWGIVVLQVLGLYPILYLNVSAAMANVDPSLRESANNLGATGWRLFRTVTLPLILPGWFAGAIIVWIWSFTDLGTPLIFGYSRLVPVQIWDSVNDLNTNPQGYTLVMFVLLLTVVLFALGKRRLGGRRHEMMARGHSAGAEVPAGPWLTAAIWAGAGVVVAAALLPHLTIVAQSLAGRWFMSALPDFWTTGHFGEVFGHGLTGSSIRNSLFYASLSALIDLVLGVLIAWLVTRRRIPFAGVLDALAMLPLALPGLVLAFGLYAGFNIDERANPRLDAFLDPRTNPTFLLIVSYSVRRLPYIVRSAHAGFQQVSVTLEEASANLGQRPLGTLWKITVPLVAANLVAGTILTFSFAMLEVSDSLILAQREQHFPITKMIYQLMGRIDPSSPSVASALGVVGMLILLGSLAVAGKLMGKRLGQLFRA
jgi:iron(III) transport system permease protein